MFQGFYNLASSMLYQNRNLNTISNNMVNSSTPGFKSDRLISTTFKDAMLYRTESINNNNSTQIGAISMMKTAAGTKTSYDQGTVEETGGNLDFALTEPGFFALEDTDGNRLYTRNGSFDIDQEGYLCLPSMGRVLDDSGNPIEITSDHISVDKSGNIYEVPLKGLGTEDGADSEDQEPNLIGKIGVTNFDDYTQLVKGDNGTFTTQAEGNGIDGGVQWKSVERSNIDTIEEMTSMMSSQRASQSAAQVLKMYDQLMSKIVTDIGRV
ncbi:flagellar hook-basal body protein [Clostridium sp. E02]|uniref:flagellar hook-basal body protein n=1 Tax=Clostridium sp. E02 TaxID=2487134 RepID=UPI000F5499E4|nr:flagellar hook-basal body protein [Clostridium sp. E02]